MNRVLIGMFLVLTLAAGGLSAGVVITVDGGVSDWGVTPGTDWTPDDASICYWTEPAVGSDGYVGPGYGGQTFNVEALYAVESNDRLYFAVVTGFPPNGASGWNGSANEQFYPGDILIDFEPYYAPGSSATAPTDTIDFAIETTTYGAGYEHGGVGAEGAGALFSNVTPGLSRIRWNSVYDAVEIGRNADHSAQGTLVGAAAEFIYSNYGSGHWVLEGSIPSDVFADFRGQDARITWTMTCANDFGQVQCGLPLHEETPGVPEPTSALLLLGSVGLGLLRRRSA